jgi:hypothetical protein
MAALFAGEKLARYANKKNLKMVNKRSNFYSNLADDGA